MPSSSVADPEFYNGADGRGEEYGEGAVPPPQKKNEFLPEKSGFWCILGLLFYVYAKIGQVNGGRSPPTPESATVLVVMMMMMMMTSKTK